MKTIALIRLLFTCSQRLCSRQLGLSPSPDRLTGRRPTSSSPGDSNGPCGHLPGTDRSAASTDSNIQDKTMECASKTCSQWERNGFWTFKPVWVSLSPLWGGCCIAGKLPLTPFPRFMWDSPSGGRKKAHYRCWFNSTKFKKGLSPIRVVISAVLRSRAGVLWSIDVGEIKTPKAEMSRPD